MIGEEVNIHSSAFTIKVSLAFGLTYIAVLFCLHHGNDGHLNSTVSLAMAVTRRIGVFRSLLYLAAQLFGAILGAYILSKLNSRNDVDNIRDNNVGNIRDHIVDNIHDNDVDNSLDNNPDNRDVIIVPLGYTVLAENVTGSQGFLVEFLSSFVLVFVVFSCYDDGTNLVNQETITVPFIVGLTLMACSLFAVPYTTGSMNTARSIGPAIIGNVWTSHWVYWFGPILGGISGGSFHDLLFYTNQPFRKILNRLLPCTARFRSPTISDSEESIQFRRSPDRDKKSSVKNIKSGTRPYGSREDDSDVSDERIVKTKVYNNPGTKFGELLRQYDQDKKMSDDSRESISGEDDSDASTKKNARMRKSRQSDRFENQELRAGTDREESDYGEDLRGNMRQTERLYDDEIGERTKRTVLKTGSSYTAKQNRADNEKNISQADIVREELNDDQCEERIQEVEKMHNDNDKKDMEPLHDDNSNKNESHEDMVTSHEDTDLIKTPVNDEGLYNPNAKTAEEASDKDSITENWEKVDRARVRTAGDSDDDDDDDDSDRDTSRKPKRPIQFGPGGVIIRPAKSPETTPTNEMGGNFHPLPRSKATPPSASVQSNARLPSIPVHGNISQPILTQSLGTLPAYVPFDLLSTMSIEKNRPPSPVKSPLPDGICNLSPGESPTDLSIGHGLTPIKELSFENGQIDSSPHIPFPQDTSISPRLEHDPTVSPPAVSISLNTLITHDKATTKKLTPDSDVTKKLTPDSDMTKKLTPDLDVTKKLTPDSDEIKKLTPDSNNTKKDTSDQATAKKSPLSFLFKKKKPPESLPINQKSSDSAAREGDKLKDTPSSEETTPLAPVQPAIRDPSSIILHPEGQVERPPFNKYAKDPLGLLSGYSSPTKTAVQGFVLVGLAKREPAQKNETDTEAVEAVVEKYVSDGEYSPLGGIVRSDQESTDDED